MALPNLFEHVGCRPRIPFAQLLQHRLVAAHGGSIDGPGPVIVGGMLYANSGYAFLGTMPGNVLLALSVDGK